MTDETNQSLSRREYIGTAAEDREDDSPYLHVIIKDLTPAISGGFGKAEDTVTVETKNVDDTPVSSSIKIANSIKAIWIGQSNRKYPPDVRKGEQVYVYKFGDTDQYYWDSTGRDSKLRKKETLRYEVANDNGNVKDLTDQNTYFLEIDTRKTKRIILRSSVSDGESYTYEILIDALNSKIHIRDSDGEKSNEITLDSATPSILLRNSEGTFINLIKRSLSMGALEDIIIGAGRQVYMDTPIVTFGNTSGAGAMVINSNGCTFNSGQSFIVNTQTFGVNGDGKITGSFVAGHVRGEGYSTGPVGSGYNGATTDIGSGSGSVPSNTPDTNTTNTGRSAASWEQITEMASAIVSAFNEVRGACGAPGNVAGITSAAAASRMAKNRGE